MPRKRKTPSREELRRLDRRRRVAEAWMAGATANDIAKRERVSVDTVYADLNAARDVILPAGTKEQLLARNYSRLEDVYRANRDGMEKGDDTATRNAVKALSEQNRMLGVNGAVNGAVNFTVHTGPKGDGSINWDLEGSIARYIGFVDPPKYAEDGAIPEPSHPRLLDYKPSEAPAGAPAPFPADAPSRPAPPSPEYEQPPVQARPLRSLLDVSPLFDPTDPEIRRYRTELDDPRFAESQKPWWKKKLTGRLRRGPIMGSGSKRRK